MPEVLYLNDSPIYGLLILIYTNRIQPCQIDIYLLYKANIRLVYGPARQMNLCIRAKQADNSLYTGLPGR